MDLGYRKSEIPVTSFPLLCIDKKARRNSQGSPGLGFRPQNIDFNANMRLLRIFYKSDVRLGMWPSYLIRCLV